MLRLRSTGELWFELIQRLTPREKAHFKRLHEANKSGSKMLALFDFLNQLDRYDASEIRIFAAERNIRLNSAYTGLQEALIRSLRLYHSNSTVSLQLNELLIQIEILHLKGLHDINGKLIEQGIHLADLHEQTGHSLLFRQWRLKHMFAIQDRKQMAEVIESQIEEISFLTEELGITMSIHHLAQLVDFTFEDSMMPFSDGKDIIEHHILRHPIISRDSAPKLTAGKYAYYDLIASGHYYLENWEVCLGYTRKLYEILMQPDVEGQTKTSPYRISVLLANLLAICNFLKDQQQFEAYLAHFDTLITQLDDEQEARLIREICIPRIDLQRMINAAITGNFELGEELIQQSLESFAQTDSREEIQIRVYTEIAHFYFRFKQLEMALSYCTLLQNFKALRHDRELFYAVSWMEVIACYGMKDDSLFSSRVRSFGHYLRDGKGRIWNLERMLLSAMTKAMYLTPDKQQAIMKPVFEKMESQRSVIGQPRRHFDLLEWVRSQAESPVDLR